MKPTGAKLQGLDDDERGLDLPESIDDALDLFTGVNQADVAAGRVDLSRLSREDRVQLLIDGETSSIFGSSPWSVGVSLDESVSQEIHAQKGGVLVFGIDTGLIDAAESVLRSVRYALVWDDTIISEVGNLKISPIGKTFLIVGIKDEPVGRKLTLWITDSGVRVLILKQGPLRDIEKLRKEMIGEIGADTGKNPVSQVIDTIVDFVTVSQIGGVIVLLAAVVGLVLIVRSDAGKDIAKAAAGALT